MKNGSPFTVFGGISEETVDSGGDHLSEAFREQGVFQHLVVPA